jgi:type I restriction enzyme R subunit
MIKLNEDAIEAFAITNLKALGYEYIYGPEIAPDSKDPKRQTFADVILLEHLRHAAKRINPNLSAEVIEDAIRQIRRFNSPELLDNNEAFHRVLTEGVKVSYQKESNTRGDQVFLIDFEHPENNEFLVVNQFTIIENNQNKRPDLILFVNGLPLVVIELKNAAYENTTIRSAYEQLNTYKATIPSLFTYNAFNIISDGLEAKAGTISADLSRFMTWKSTDGQSEASHLVSQLETLMSGMLNKATLIDLVRHFIVFEKTSKEDPKTKQISISTVKKMAAYHQYYAVNAAVASTLRATGMSADLNTAHDPANHGLTTVNSQPKGDRKAGVVWHTQGSGKSLSMVFYTGKIVLALDNPTILVITDRNDLDDQLFDTFAASSQLLRQEPKQVEDRQQLKTLLKVASGGVIFTTIQKFQPEEGNVFEMLSDRRNIVVIADEAHRTQYGFRAKTVEDKNEAGEVVGQKIVYGFAKVYARCLTKCDLSRVYWYPN